MVDPDRLHRLLTWSAATFHASLFFAGLVTVFHLNGSLGFLLADLSTLAGFGLFGAFWLITWWATRRALRGIDWTRVNGLGDIAGKGRRALWSGGLNGLLFFWVLLAFLVVSNLVLILSRGGLELGFVNFLLFAATAGSAVAFVVGAGVGLVFALLDAAVFAVVWGWAAGAAPAAQPGEAATAD